MTHVRIGAVVLMAGICAGTVALWLARSTPQDADAGTESLRSPVPRQDAGGPASDRAVPSTPAPPRANVEVGGRRFVHVGANGFVPASRWAVPRQGPLWDAERAWWDAGDDREARRVATEQRHALLERLAADPARRRVLAARLAVLGYRLHASAEGLEDASVLAQMVELELDAMQWLLEGRTDVEGAQVLLDRARPWCEAGRRAVDPDVVERARACLD